MTKPGRVDFLNPSGMRTNPAFTNVVVASGSVKTVYVGALDPVDAAGAIVGRGDIAAQTAQIFDNLQVALSAAGARLEDVVLWRIYVVQGHSFQSAFGVFQRVWGARPHPPANTLLLVAGLGHPDFLISLEAVAVVAEP